VVSFLLKLSILSSDPLELVNFQVPARIAGSALLLFLLQAINTTKTRDKSILRIPVYN
jgi:hypothetical protein